MNNTGIIILAAGGSTRFGNAKQLLHFNSKALLQHVTDEAIEAGASIVVVVTGAKANEVSENIDRSRVQIVLNERWQQGIASSIVTGVQAITNGNNVEKIIIAVCDQPFVSASLFQQLYDTHQQTGKHIVACSYENTLGTPVLFDKTMFPELLKLEGDIGAKRVIMQHINEVEVVIFPEGNIDIDTEADYQKLVTGNPGLS